MGAQPYVCDPTAGAHMYILKLYFFDRADISVCGSRYSCSTLPWGLCLCVRHSCHARSALRLIRQRAEFCIAPLVLLRRAQVEQERSGARRRAVRADLAACGPVVTRPGCRR